MATRPTPTGVVFNKSDEKDWDDDDPSLRSAERPAITETWMLLEYCDRGNLDSAMRNGRFKRKADGLPDLVCAYCQRSDSLHGGA